MDKNEYLNEVMVDLIRGLVEDNFDTNKVSFTPNVFGVLEVEVTEQGNVFYTLDFSPAVMVLRSQLSTEMLLVFIYQRLQEMVG